MNNKCFMYMVVLSTLLLITKYGKAQTDKDQFMSLAYEGGMFTHPGFSLGYHQDIDLNQSWSIELGGKAGFYSHRRFQNTLFFIPSVRMLHQGKKGLKVGPDLQLGYLHHFVPSTYSLNDAGTISTNQWASDAQWMWGVGFYLGKKLDKLPISWFVEPQLQFRRPNISGAEKYLLLSLGIQYHFK